MSSLKVQFQDVQLPGWPLQPESFPPAAWIRKIQIPQLAGSIQFHSISALLYIIQIKIMTALMTSKWLILKPNARLVSTCKSANKPFISSFLASEKGQPIQPTIGIYRAPYVIHSKTPASVSSNLNQDGCGHTGNGTVKSRAQRCRISVA